MKKRGPTVAETVDILRERIVNGDFGQYGRLPPAVDLAQQFHVSRDTINRVLKILQAEGYLESRGENRRGVIISRSRMRIQGITARFDLELEKLGVKAVETNIEEPALVPAPANIAKVFGIAEGAMVTRRFRKQGAEKENVIVPYRLAENFYPVSLADETIVEQMKKDDRLDVVLAIQDKYGKVPVNVHEDVIGRLPTNRERQLLNITAGTPVIQVDRINYAEDGTAVMANKIIFVANLFTLSYDYHTKHWKQERTNP